MLVNGMVKIDWKRVRVVYGATLEMLCTFKGYREFESLRFRLLV